MADADEDAVQLPASHDSAGQIEHDFSDETQDFRFLSSLSLVSDLTQSTLPRRGEKDFEPNPTLLQSDVLASSRQAMHNAILFPRLHNPRNQVIGIYTPEGPSPPPAALKAAIVSASSGDGSQVPVLEMKSSRTRTGVSEDACVYVSNPKGQFFRTMGQADRWNRVWLLPEEALYLLERGTLDIRWPSSITGSAGGDQDEKDEESSIPMSLQAAYTCLVGRGGLTLERFAVYTGLKRGGYTIVRAPSWDETQPVDKDSYEVKTSTEDNDEPGFIGFLGRLFRSIYNFNRTEPAKFGPLVGLGIHRSYNDIYNRLSLIPAENPSVPNPPTRHTEPPFRIAYHVYKPSTPFRKSAPPNPDFRIAVVNARTQTTLPTLSQLRALLESTPFDPPRGEKMERQLYMRLRHGYRHVILAVVDQGVVSFLRVADAGFSKEKIYHNQGAPREQKRGGFSSRGGGRGRGRGQGK